MYLSQFFIRNSKKYRVLTGKNVDVYKNVPVVIFGHVMIFSAMVAFFGFQNRIEGAIIMRKGLGSQITWQVPHHSFYVKGLSQLFEVTRNKFPDNVFIL